MTYRAAPVLALNFDRRSSHHTRAQAMHSFTAYAVIRRRGRNTVSGRFGDAFLPGSPSSLSNEALPTSRLSKIYKEELTFAKSHATRQQTFLYSMLHPFLHILYTCTKYMLTLDRHHLNKPRSYLLIHIILELSLLLSVSSVIHHRPKLLFLLRLSCYVQTSTPPSSFCPGLAVTNILVDHGNQVSGRLARLFARTPHLPINMDTRHPGRGFSNSLKTCRNDFR
ncbi:hypothetical protein M436DRAFT_71915 [Aureobasidium namibiae CBS 147.97]|uniref:Uncharacterized protein n=1 Tax=Aureobasidium namibiae CBS 147.97 TaxID=1043004 RepID=A0A074WMY5_9PEZI|nr:uncharacterized protein M436DRAFT_71915 [Aureobasidium namibiae CBS 147.97]KEQ74493.1 hypothetical protein M436DRAFT_71915 [Aureobasidium namibiae CBS 147.97]